MPEIEIRDARTAEELAAVRRLCLDYRRHLAEHDPMGRVLVDSFYPEAAYAETLDRLPEGHDAVLLALAGGKPVGCAMSHALEDGSCEIKRVYVSPEGRGRGAARALVQELLTRARARGQSRALLDTMKTLHAARALYTAMGFHERGPYATYAPGEAEELCFFEIPLS
ncbi:GNAT family N-acetyltransferase [Salipiger abyssi]|uniref:Acetyltransferase n=1 Tax=Salipiger abyssi TaxID=1250539 RepID=A0A1P8UY51_9RHOB|nr:GNAT family N-acetyltransferase [Salipiger abyssi]APZ54311.1 acetyltransferase [Salipiger abyssi]